jgi:transcriptional regulator with XRE-family HTH domain
MRQRQSIGRMAKPSPNHAGSPFLVALGSEIRAIRRAKGISQEALALLTELDRSYVGGIERGEHNLTLINLKKIASALGTKPSQLLQAAGY